MIKLDYFHLILILRQRIFKGVKYRVRVRVRMNVTLLLSKTECYVSTISNNLLVKLYNKP